MSRDSVLAAVPLGVAAEAMAGPQMAFRATDRTGRATISAYSPGLRMGRIKISVQAPGRPDEMEYEEQFQGDEP